MSDVPNANFKKPEGARGIETLSEMNESHKTLYDWGLSKLNDVKPAKILDIGCGGGMFIRLLSEKFPGSIVYGMDYSEESVKMARNLNKTLTEAGRCEIVEASVSSIPYCDGEFDLVTAVETYFFWPDLNNDLKEVSRVISDGGSVMILAESYPDPRFDEQNEKYEMLYDVKLRKNEEIESILESVGFSVTVETVPENNWVVFVGKKI